MTLQIESFAHDLTSDTFNYRQLNAKIMLDRMSVADVQLTKDSPKWIKERVLNARMSLVAADDKFRALAEASGINDLNGALDYFRKRYGARPWKRPYRTMPTGGKAVSHKVFGRTHCRRGHLLDDANTSITGERVVCKTCRNIAKKKWEEKHGRMPQANK